MHKNQQKVQKNFYPQHEQVEFRLLCKSHAIGGLIGANGTIIKSLQQQTSSKIYVDVSGPVFKHRVVHVIASYTRTNTVTLDGVVYKVSPAQESLIRVFDRVVEAEAEAEAYHFGDDGGGGGGGVLTCVLVVGPGMVGAVLGKGGIRVQRVIKETGAFVKVLSFDVVPPGASSDDELVQITGASLPVKKALVAVSQFLQQYILYEKGALQGNTFRLLDQSMKIDSRNARVNNPTSGGAEAEVVFKLICAYKAAGFVIGYKGQKVRSIEEETRASIRFSDFDSDNHERVVTISAFENRESQNSLAQDATVRVFSELVSSEEGVMKEGNAVTAKLLILPYQSDWLSKGDDPVMSTIHNANGTTLRIMELNNPQVGVASDEKVLQIDGDYPNVQVALFQVTWILRERIFDASLPKGCLPLLPHKLLTMSSRGHKISALTGKMNNCRVSKETNGSRPPMFPHSQFSTGSSITTGTVSSGDSTTSNGDSKFASQSFVVTNTTLEIAVREDVFNAVYGENGSNLSRLRTISGATVEVQDPSAGSDGKVIISGTRDQTMVAQSLLQAFLMTA